MYIHLPIWYQVDVSKNRGTPKWMVKIMENPMNKWMIWGVFPLFLVQHPNWFQSINWACQRLVRFTHGIFSSNNVALSVSASSFSDVAETRRGDFSGLGPLCLSGDNMFVLAWTNPQITFFWGAKITFGLKSQFFGGWGGAFSLLAASFDTFPWNGFAWQH